MTGDRDVDERLREWGERARADGRGTEVELAGFTPGRGRARWSMAAAAVSVVAVALLVIGLSSGLGGRGGHQPSHQPPHSVTALSGSRQVLRDGDVVQADGTVVSTPAGGVEFCNDNYATAQPQIVPVPPTVCPDGPNTVRVTGVDLARLTGRSVVAGTVQGRATLRGVYRSGVLRVQQQGPATRPAADPPSHLSCTGQRLAALPASTRARFAGGRETAISDYRHTHPGAIIDFGLLRPDRTHAVAYVLTAAATAPVRTALMPAYGKSLCVVRSRYTAQQITSAAAAMNLSNAAPRQAGATGSSQGISPVGQEQIRLTVAYVSPALARLVATEPAGLVQLDPWLLPVTK